MARPIQFDLRFSTPFPSLELTSLSNWRTTRPIQFDVTYSTHVASLKLTSFNFLTVTDGRRVRNFNVPILTRAIFMPGFNRIIK